jgi:hypothetical protein
MEVIALPFVLCIYIFIDVIYQMYKCNKEEKIG